MKQRIFVRKQNSNDEFTVYDIFGLSTKDLERVKYQVFAEVNQDIVTTEPDLPNAYVLEYLPGQFDVRADSAMQCLRMLGYDATVRCGYGRTGAVTFNPVEMRLKDMSRLELQEYSPDRSLPPKVPITPQLRTEMGLAMSAADLQFVKEYFDSRGRTPTETEIRVIDTYWSDHCRHTTFETELTDAQFTGLNADFVRSEWNRYLREHNAHNAQKPLTLMDLATLSAKRQPVKHQEVSSEINACSVYTQVNGQKYILQFKNETHNHPTEIEPFGGASTCIGGAIRDPLSGRSFVYQAMRISGSHDPINDREIVGKLSSRDITTKAAHGYASYGNQIGLATTFVDEIYHPGYRAKRLELGFVMGAAPADAIIRQDPLPGDFVLLLGGRTGRDGIGGATGSSKKHDRSSTALCGAEVQKGNAPMERKIQRLFRRPEVTRLIKKCNDFGAGGVSVAIGELAPGITIELDRVPVKYQGLNATEIAISESQERMAVVVAPADVAAFSAACAQEDIEVTHVATITAEPRLVMRYLGHEVVAIDRSFLDTNGVRQRAQFTCDSAFFPGLTPELTHLGDDATKLRKKLADLNVCSKRGLQQIFDATIGATTALLPYGGRTQSSPSQVSAQLISVLDYQRDADVASVAAAGYAVEVADTSPFHAGATAVVLSLAKAVAAGVDYHDLYFTFQEYFQRLGTDRRAWGDVVQTLLGANRVLRHFHLAAIGGKDSMSGTFEDLHVPPTLVSFAVGVVPAHQLRSTAFTRAGLNLYLLETPIAAEPGIDLEVFKQHLRLLCEGSTRDLVQHAWALGNEGIAAALTQMAFGNRVGFAIDAPPQLDLYRPRYGSFVIATEEPLDLKRFPHVVALGRTIADACARINGTPVDLEGLFSTWEEPLSSVFPHASEPVPEVAGPVTESVTESATGELPDQVAAAHTPSRGCVPATAATNLAATPAPRYSGTPHQPVVLIPVFTGTNCEYDMARAFERAGARTQILVYQDAQQLAAALDAADIFALPGGFSAADEPDGCAKFITAVLRQPSVNAAVTRLLEREGLILGICNGFQALIKSGLLPYGMIRELDPDSPTLARNACGHHVAQLVRTRISSLHSPWLQGFQLGQEHIVPISHGEGRIVMSPQTYTALRDNGQVATQYVGDNPNGSAYAIEGLLDPSGQILGKMGHSERFGECLYQNFDEPVLQDLFKNGVNYFQCK